MRGRRGRRDAVVVDGRCAHALVAAFGVVDGRTSMTVRQTETKRMHHHVLRVGLDEGNLLVSVINEVDTMENKM